jgi:hypothetical protein
VFANFLSYARAALMESQSHLRDAADKKYISEETRLELDAMAVTALEEVTGLMEYLQSPEALRNARRARERRIASRAERLANRKERPPKGAGAQNAGAQSAPNPQTENSEH